MTQIYLIILLCLAPIWTLGTYLLFHGHIFHLRIIEISHKAKLNRNDLLIIFFGVFLILVMILRRAPLMSIGLLIFALTLLLYYFSGRPDRLRTSNIKKSESEFPAILAVFTIYISAGLSPAQSLVKIVDTGKGALVDEIAIAVRQIRSGSSAYTALEQLALTTSSQALRRFIDSLLIAMERGTSLHEVLNRQMSELRGEQHSRALEFAARSEITLMIPIVFLILPVSVLFALWPSYVALGRNIGI